MSAKRIRLSRFTGSAHIKLLGEFARLWRESHQPTGAEREIRAIRHSLEHDVKPTARSHKNGLDVRSLAKSAMTLRKKQQSQELHDREIALVRAEIALTEEFLRERQSRLRALCGERSGYDRRVIEMSEARERIENRERATGSRISCAI